MSERDPVSELLREWEPIQPSLEFDARMAQAYRSQLTRVSIWRRCWSMRISVPVPAFVFAAMFLIALVFWFRAAQPQPSVSRGGIVTQLDSTGFQPLPNGAARVIPIKDLRR